MRGLSFFKKFYVNLKNNRALREKNRWKFEDKSYPMPDTYGQQKITFEKKRMVKASKRKLYRTTIEFALIIAHFFSFLVYLMAQLLKSKKPPIFGGS